MSRYDGLIIPRSYSEYINKTDAATLQQALQLSGVLSGAVAAGDNKAVKSSAVYNALDNYQEYKMQLVSNVNVDNCIPTNSDKVCFFRGVMTNTPYGNATAVVLMSKYYFAGSFHNVYQEIEQYGKASDNYNPIKYIRYGYKGNSETEYTWSPWQKLTTETDLANFIKIQTITGTVDTNGSLNVPLNLPKRILSAYGGNKLYIPFVYSSYWVLYCMNVGGSKVQSGTELTVTIIYYE